MVKAQSGSQVQVHYTGTLADGSVFDSSVGGEPLEFTIGMGQMIQGFEQGVLGMEEGQSKTIAIPASEAYGPHHPDRVIQVQRSQLPPNLAVKIGSQLQNTTPSGRRVTFTVTALTDTQVTLDGNHPLAGKDLTFLVQMMRIG
ncbi:MAG: peptidylprolyl isomerase [SAR202 cluster bacterium]|nr:peptidylprolyl isomerase [SAR202 cluster bacterium]